MSFIIEFIRMIIGKIVNEFISNLPIKEKVSEIWQNKKKRWMCIAAMLIIALIGVIGPKIWDYINNRPEPFEEGDYGILVAGFEEKADKPQKTGKDVQGMIEMALNARFNELKIKDAKAREIPISYIPFFTSHEDARKIGKKYHAELVIWGNITSAGVYPNITVVNPTSTTIFLESESLKIKPSELVIIKYSESLKVKVVVNVNPSSESVFAESEMTLLKDTLTHAALADIKDIRLSALTDEPTMLVSFVTGKKYYDKGDYDKALEYFEQSLPANPSKYIDTAPVFFYIGYIHSYRKEYDKAVENYSKSLDINPKSAEAYIGRGIAYAKKGEYGNAIADYSKAIDINPKDAGAYYNRGVVYAKKNEYDKAIADYNKALDINPKDAGAYNNRGIA